jgi:hypothetical protein
MPYFASAPILLLGLVLPCGSVDPLVALGSEPRFADQLLPVDSLILSSASHIRECCLRAEVMALSQSPLASCCSYHP